MRGSTCIESRNACLCRLGAQTRNLMAPQGHRRNEEGGQKTDRQCYKEGGGDPGKKLRDVLNNKSSPRHGTPPACIVTPKATTTFTVARSTKTTSGASASEKIRLCTVFSPAAITSKTECEQVLKAEKGDWNVKSWSLEILNNIYAEPSGDGNLIRCSACGIKGRTQWVINMRHPYAEAKWNKRYLEVFQGFEGRI